MVERAPLPHCNRKSIRRTNTVCSLLNCILTRNRLSNFRAQVDTSTGELPYVDASHIYNGHVLGEANSHVFGSIHDGVFEGKIITENDSYYIEHAKRYFPNGTHRDYGFHSVIYNERDVVDDPFAHRRRPGHANGCGINEDIAQWMESVQNGGIDDEDIDDIPTKPVHINGANSEQTAKSNRNPNSIFEDDKSPYFKYSKAGNFDYDGASGYKKSERVKRAARPKEDNRNTCSLYIQTDPLIWRHIREGIAHGYPAVSSFTLIAIEIVLTQLFHSN